MALSYHSAVLSTRYHRLIGYPIAHARSNSWHWTSSTSPCPSCTGPVGPVTERPFDPDDLPIEAVQTEEERRIAATLPAHVYAPGGSRAKGDRHRQDDEPRLRPRPLSLKALAGRILGQGDN